MLVFKNYRRVAEVWMDEYAKYLYDHRPHYKSIDTGDISKQLAIRKKLKCKPFKWFMEEVAFDLPKFYPPVEPPAFAKGEVRSNIQSRKSTYMYTCTLKMAIYFYVPSRMWT